jgi:hypothetical protein
MTDNTDEIAALRRELAQVKAAQPLDRATLEREAAEWRDKMHQMSETRMSHASAFSREQLAAMEAATPRDMIHDLVRHGVVQSPSAAGSSGQVTKVSSNPGLPGSNTGGWVTATPIGPPPGVALADRLMDAQDIKDRHELMMAEARRLAALK